MPPKHPVIALVGPSGCGKSAIMLKLFEKMSGKVFPMITVTSRPKRDASDDIFYKFLSPDQIREMAAKDELAQYLEYAGNLYGSVRTLNDETLAKGFGIQAYVEQGIYDLRTAGYDVIPVKITADNVQFRDEKRIKADEERSKTPIDYAATIHNSFVPGGLEKAADELIAFLSTLDR